MKNLRVIAGIALAVLAAAVLVAVPLSGAADAQTTVAPAVQMNAGDTFEYRAETNMPAEITAAGSGMQDEGGFLTWDPDRDLLTGTAGAVGSYTVILTAVWAQDGLEQTAEQQIRFEIAPAGDGDPDTALLTYDASADQWQLEFTSTADTQSVGHDGGSLQIDPLLVAAAAVVLALVGIAAVRLL